MIWQDIKQLKTGPRDLRRFGLLVGGVFAVLGILLWLRGKGHFAGAIALPHGSEIAVHHVVHKLRAQMQQKQCDGQRHGLSVVPGDGRKYQPRHAHAK